MGTWSSSTPATRQMWEFSRARKLGDGDWIASVIDVWDLDGPGYRGAPSRGRTGWRIGSRAAGVPFLPGLIRMEELDAGVITHDAPGHGTHQAGTAPRRIRRRSGSCAPPVAARTDGWGVGPQYIPEGARLHLESGLRIQWAAGLSDDAITIAVALQTYGVIMADNAPNFALGFQNLGEDGGGWNDRPGIWDVQKIPLDAFSAARLRVGVPPPHPRKPRTAATPGDSSRPTLRAPSALPGAARSDCEGAGG